MHKIAECSKIQLSILFFRGSRLINEFSDDLCLGRNDGGKRRFRGCNLRMYFLFLSIGALLSSVAAAFGQPLWVQIVILVAVTGLGILIVRPIIKKKFESKIKKAEEDILKEPEEGHNENPSKQGIPEETEKE